MAHGWGRLGGGAPGPLRLHNFFRDLKQLVDRAVYGFWRCSLSDFETFAALSGECRGHDLMRTELVPDGRPRRMDAGIAKHLLDRHKQLIGEYADKDMRLSAVF